MKITVTQQVLGGKVEKRVVLDDPERTSLAPTANEKKPKVPGVTTSSETTAGNKSKGAPTKRKEVTNGE